MSFEKASYEEFYRYFDFKNLLSNTETISTASATVTDISTGTDVSSSMISDVGSYGGTQVVYKIKGGTVGKTYAIKIMVVTSNDQKFTNDYHEQLFCIIRR